MDNSTQKIEDMTTKATSADSYMLAKPKNKRRIAFKAVTAVIYSLITLLAYGINTLLLFDALKSINTVTEGWDSLGRGIGLALVIYLTIIVACVAVFLYQIPIILSIVGLATSFKAKNGIKKQGKIFFSVLLALSVISAFLIVLMTVGIILLIKFGA